MNLCESAAAITVGAHLLANAGHGIGHALIPVGLTPLQIAFVIVVMGVTPVVAVWLVARRRYQVGGLLLALSMAGSFVFGVAFHFVLATPDHVHAVPAGPWHGHFEWTAVTSTLVAGTGIAVGAWIGWPTSDVLTPRTASK